MITGLALLLTMNGSPYPLAKIHPAGIMPVHLRCEYLVDPIGVEAQPPRLSWKPLATDPKAHGLEQSAYRILVASDPRLLVEKEADLWDFGTVASPKAFGIAYAGRKPAPGTTAYWKVRLFDGQGRRSAWSNIARWTTGPIWRAKWIRLPLPPLKESDADPNNGFHGAIESSPDDIQWVQIDLGRTTPIEKAILFPARPYDFTDTPGFLFPVRFKIEASDDPSFVSSQVLVDRTQDDFANPGSQPVELKSAGKGRYVRLTVVKLARRDGPNYSYALAEMQLISNGGNAALHKLVTANKSTESGAWSKDRLVDGTTVSHGPKSREALPATYLRKEFALPADPKRAVLFATALGAYECRINGRRVGDHILAPEWTDYRDRVQYQGFDVTKLLKKGPNAMAAILGDGWYAGRVGWFGRAVWGRRPALLAQLEIETVDGERTKIVSDQTWRAIDAGPIRTADIMDGEAFDARKEMPGWDLPDFNPRGWNTVQEIKQKAAIVDQPNEPIRVVQRLRTVDVTEPKNGVYVCDFGQNMVGWVRATLVGKPGATATLRYAEALSDDGNVYRANLRGAPETDTYTFGAAGKGAVEPHFTYHGFRYIEITGVTRKPRPEDVVGMVFCSSSPEIGKFACSDEMLNRLWLNIFWTQRANLMSVPTDCPQRDERLGWMGDIQAFSQAAAYNMDLDGFVAKWARDLRDAQSATGLYSEFSPWPGPKNTAGGSPAWSDAGVFVPWTAFLNSGDKRLVADHYASAKRYVDFLHVNNPDGLWLNKRGSDFNDWLNGDTISKEGWPTTGAAVPPEVLATAFLARSTQIVAEMAEALGKKNDAEKYSALGEKSREAFCHAYVDADGRVKGDTQAGYALALNFDLLPADLRPAAAKHMAHAVAKYDDHLSTGIQTTHRLMLELTRAGYNDLAYKLILNRTFPSWGFNIENGATTIWERWDGYVKGRGFQDPGMNSLNHWALGAVGEWMMKVIGGLSPGDEPGWAHPIIRPRPGGGLTWAKASYDSVRGLVASSWRVDKAGFSLVVTIPVGTTATVYIPLGPDAHVTADGAKLLRREPDSWVYEVQSGTYKFTAR